MPLRRAISRRTGISLRWPVLLVAAVLLVLCCSSHPTARADGNAAVAAPPPALDTPLPPNVHLPPSTPQTPGDALVHQAQAQLARLDAHHPDLHHVGARLIREVIEPNLVAAGLAQWGADLGAPDWMVGADDVTARVTRDVRTYVASAKDAVRLLMQAWSDERHVDAGRILASIALFGNYTLPVSPKTAFSIYSTLANVTGDVDAHYYLGFFYSTNLGGVLGPSIASVRQDTAQLHYTLAAYGGHAGAQMTLGYRHLMGIGASRSCETSAFYYYQVAKKVLDLYYAGPPGGRSPPPARVSLPAEAGGMYGPGSATKAHASKAESAISDEDEYEFFKYHADEGDPYYQLLLGKRYYDGTHASIPQNYDGALRYLHRAASVTVPSVPAPAAAPARRDSDGNAPAAVAGDQQQQQKPVQVSPEIKQRRAIVGQAAHLLGRMYLRGEGVVAHNATAERWFRLGASHGDADSLAWVGIMALDMAHAALADALAESPRSVTTIKAHRAAAARAVDLLRKAAIAGNLEAHAVLGLRYADTERYADAIKYLTLAAAHGHIPAMMRLAELYLAGRGTAPSCTMAVALLKNVAEHGAEWIEPVMTHAHELVVDPDLPNADLALLFYWLAAERGIETAQSNVAWLIEHRAKTGDGRGWLDLDWLFTDDVHARLVEDEGKSEAAATSESEAGWQAYVPPATMDADEVALVYWNRAANQNNPEARVKVGDQFYHGRGAPQDFAQALQYYSIAAESDLTGLAMWNLAYMYHHGLGAPKDRHLAKRYYDLALATNSDAWLPVSLSLLHLHAANWYAFLTDAIQGWRSGTTTPNPATPTPAATPATTPAPASAPAPPTPPKPRSVPTKLTLLDRMRRWLVDDQTDLELTAIALLVLTMVLAYLMYLRQMYYQPQVQRRNLQRQALERAMRVQAEMARERERLREDEERLRRLQREEVEPLLVPETDIEGVRRRMAARVEVDEEVEEIVADEWPVATVGSAEASSSAVDPSRPVAASNTAEVPKAAATSSSTDAPRFIAAPNSADVASRTNGPAQSSPPADSLPADVPAVEPALEHNMHDENESGASSVSVSIPTQPLIDSNKIHTARPGAVNEVSSPRSPALPVSPSFGPVPPVARPEEQAQEPERGPEPEQESDQELELERMLTPAQAAAAAALARFQVAATSTSGGSSTDESAEEGA
ncbi:ERAD-associated protein [Allomyces arbusculus]|nr:ERAD-associated protein [Allomyces arbusculus]